MFKVIYEVLCNAFDPLYVDDRCELEKKKDKEACLIVSVLMFIALSIAFIF